VRDAGGAESRHLSSWLAETVHEAGPRKPALVKNCNGWSFLTIGAMIQAAQERFGEGPVAIIVLRRVAAFADSLRDYRVYLDGDLLGEIAESSEVTITTDAGRHHLKLVIDLIFSGEIDI
jgi:hypothetical protein